MKNREDWSLITNDSGHIWPPGHRDEKSWITGGFIDGTSKLRKGDGLISKGDGLFNHQGSLTEDSILRMYAILRGDLDMTPGKSASQAGHAFKLLTRKIMLDDTQVAEAYFADGMGTNVCLIAKNEIALARAYEQAIASGLCCELIIDEHHIMPPHFTGEPIVTALGIGPCCRSDVHHITKQFNCLK